MSEQDKRCIAALGISVARFARAVDKSRQTVHRGVRSAHDYIRPRDLMTAITYWQQTDTVLYRRALTYAVESYPGIVASLPTLGTNSFESSMPGTYLFASGDLVGFLNEMPTCAEQLNQLCQAADTKVELIVQSRDIDSAERFSKRFAQRTVVYRPLDGGLLLLGILIRTDEHDSLSLFGCGEGGFTMLSRSEGVRIRSALLDVLPS